MNDLSVLPPVRPMHRETIGLMTTPIVDTDTN